MYLCGVVMDLLMWSLLTSEEQIVLRSLNVCGRYRLVLVPLWLSILFLLGRDMGFDPGVFNCNLCLVGNRPS